MIFALKACPRCHGDLYADADGELSCLMCGHEVRLMERRRLSNRLQIEPLQPPISERQTVPSR